MKKNISFLFALIFTSILLIPLQVLAQDAGVLDLTNVTPETVAAFFKPAISELRQKKIAIKILTPSFIPSGKGTLYTIPFNDLARPYRTDRYVICLDYSPRLDSPGDCKYIVLTAEKFGFKYPNGRVDIFPLVDILAESKTDYLQNSAQYLERPNWITLVNGNKALYLLHPNFSSVSWDDSGVRYVIYVPKTTKDQVLKIVNSIYK